MEKLQKNFVLNTLRKHDENFLKPFDYMKILICTLKILRPALNTESLKSYKKFVAVLDFYLLVILLKSFMEL